MIFGIGTDIFEVKRIKKQFSSDCGLKEKLFTAKEIEYCQSKRNNAQNYAARYAAKEAFFKALGCGWRDGLAYDEVEIINDKLGKPEVILHGKTKKSCEENRITKIHISLSHAKDYATAIVVLES